MITPDTFISSTMNTVDAVIGDFVTNTYAHLVQANAGVISLLFTLYIMLIGYQVLLHSQHFSMGEVVKHVVTLLCVYALVMNWRLYHVFIYNVFTNEPGNVAQVLINSAGSGHGSSVAKALDSIYLAVMNAASGFLGQVNFSPSGIAFIFYSMLVFAIGSLMCVYALLLFVYAKMMMAIALALGPIFILFYLWNPTKGMFAAWLRKLITIALIPVVTSAILVLMLSVINVTLPQLNVPANEIQFYGIAPFLSLSLATTMLLSQVFRICSSLGGGITLDGISAGTAIIGALVMKSGLRTLGNGSKDWAKNRVNQLRNRKFRGGK
jgi:type IV secretion system protein VirB6